MQLQWLIHYLVTLLNNNQIAEEPRSSLLSHEAKKKTAEARSSSRISNVFFNANKEYKGHWPLLLFSSSDWNWEVSSAKVSPNHTYTKGTIDVPCQMSFHRYLDKLDQFYGNKVRVNNKPSLVHSDVFNEEECKRYSSSVNGRTFELFVDGT